MRNKILLAMSVAGMMCSATAFAEDSTATASGKITAIATVNDAPCDIQAGDDNLTIDFKQVSNKKLKTTGPDEASLRHVSIHLVNCSFDKEDGPPSSNKLSKVDITFSGNQSPDNKYFANSTANGMAENVGLLLRKTDGSDIAPSGKIADQQLTIGNNNTINFNALLANTGTEGSVTTGRVEIPVTYTLTYH
ncbi:fimbrial protein StdA [Salmonella enterica]|nr:fimbrial protein StdA [Salmonella enterica]EBT4079295.1 fimbrial protein StdA [Salmonella enterica]EGE4753857.1 fimbrial protein [Salmonella enterica subsp. diarizonae serovar 38:[k]:z35]